MYLTVHNVVHYLLERGYVSSARIVHGGCRVDIASSRNRCFKVSFDSGPGVFVKQTRQADAVSQTCLEIESMLVRAFHDGEISPPLAKHVPTVIGYDKSRAVLCSTLLVGAKSLRNVQADRRDLRTAVASKLGDALAKFHSPAAARLLDRIPNAARHRVPSLLHDGSLNITSRHDPAGIYTRIRAYPEYAKLLRTVAGLWCPDGLMHGDLRWDNVLIAEAESELHVSLIDWELAGGGESAWDVAGVLQSYLIDWTADALDTDEMQELVWRFWSAYRTRRAGPARESNFLRRAVTYTGCRLVQSTFEQCQFGIQLDSHALSLLQLSWNILRDPAAAEGELLGLSGRHPRPAGTDDRGIV